MGIVVWSSGIIEGCVLFFVGTSDVLDFLGTRQTGPPTGKVQLRLSTQAGGVFASRIGRERRHRSAAATSLDSNLNEKSKRLLDCVVLMDMLLLNLICVWSLCVALCDAPSCVLSCCLLLFFCNGNGPGKKEG